MRVVLAEDLFLLRDGLVRLLQAHDFEIAAAVETGPELAAALAELDPDVAVALARLVREEGLVGNEPAHGDDEVAAAA